MPMGPSKMRKESNFFHDFKGFGGPNRVYFLNMIPWGCIFAFKINKNWLRILVPLSFWVCEGCNVYYQNIVLKLLQPYFWYYVKREKNCLLMQNFITFISVIFWFHDFFYLVMFCSFRRSIFGFRILIFQIS